MKIKICCISSIEEAELTINAGADAIGLVSHMPSGPGVIDEHLIREISDFSRNRVETFLLTSLTTADQIIDQHDRCQTTTIQLCDHVQYSELEILRKKLPSPKLVKVIHVTDKNSIDEAKVHAKYVDCLLLDSGNQKLSVKKLGGTGKTHDWSISREIVKQVSVPVFLAGGLNPSNVSTAIEQVRPHGIDVCSGVRTNGKMDKEQLAEFIETVRTSAWYTD